ncbi:hypothetical protein GCM10022420_070990 [Streptomyces iranensis]
MSDTPNRPPGAEAGDQPAEGDRGEVQTASPPRRHSRWLPRIRRTGKRLVAVVVTTVATAAFRPLAEDWVDKARQFLGELL